jgi:hypothetical protein
MTERPVLAEPVTVTAWLPNESRWRIRREWSNRHNGQIYRIERRWWLFWFEYDFEFDVAEAKRTVKRAIEQEILRKDEAIIAEADDDGNWS